MAKGPLFPSASNFETEPQKVSSFGFGNPEKPNPFYLSKTSKVASPLSSSNFGIAESIKKPSFVFGSSLNSDTISNPTIFGTSTLFGAHGPPTSSSFSSGKEPLKNSQFGANTSATFNDAPEAAKDPVKNGNMMDSFKDQQCMTCRKEYDEENFEESLLLLQDVQEDLECENQDMIFKLKVDKFCDKIKDDFNSLRKQYLGLKFKYLKMEREKQSHLNDDHEQLQSAPEAVEISKEVSIDLEVGGRRVSGDKRTCKYDESEQPKVETDFLNKAEKDMEEVNESLNTSPKKE